MRLGVWLGMTAGALVGLSAYTFHYAHGTSYLKSDPKACVNCHIMQPQYDAWSRSSHHAVASCVDCHLPRHGLGKWVAKMDNGFRHSAAFTLQNFSDPIRIIPRNRRILERNCVSCHEGMVTQVAHAPGAEGGTLSCLSCHAQVGHGASQ